MKDIIYISGHKNPDTDSICSAIGYAAFKNLTSSDKTYVPIRLGEVNAETKFVLDYFKVEEPAMMDSIKLKVSDLDYSRVPSLTPNVSIAKAQEYLSANNIDYITVTDESNVLCGMLTASSLNKIYTDVWNDNILFESKTSLKNIVETLNARVLYVNENIHIFPGNILIAAMSDAMIKTYAKEGDIVIIGDRENNIETLINIAVSLIILTGSVELSNNLLDRAKDKGVTIISTKADSFTASRLLLQSIPISYVMTSDNLVTFYADDLVKDIKNVMIKTRHRSFPIIDDKNHVLGIVSRYALLSKDRKQLIQVDHNEYAQSIDGVEEAEIIEVIDHHRVADIQTSYPIFFRNEPVGSTSTIVAKIFIERGITISREIAGILMSGILSDTLIFKSPTCTEEDIEICHLLADIVRIENIEAFAYDMLKEATKLDKRNVADIFNSDFKEFKIGKLKVGIAQMNTLDITGFKKIKNKMLEYMQSILNEGGYDIILLVLTDIVSVGSLFVATGMVDVVEKSFNIELVDSDVYVPGILSRKKQIVPILSKYLDDEF
jgi:manganese-dependent inorganic pyrophosphatase